MTSSMVITSRGRAGPSLLQQAQQSGLGQPKPEVLKKSQDRDPLFRMSLPETTGSDLINLRVMS